MGLLLKICVEITVRLSISPLFSVEFSFALSTRYIIILGEPFCVVQKQHDCNYQESNRRYGKGNPEKKIFTPCEYESLLA